MGARSQRLSWLWPHDLLHEFFAVFLGVWASFVLNGRDFSLALGIAVLAATAIPVYRLVHAFAPERRPLPVRWLYHYLPTLIGAILAVLAIAWLVEQLVPDRSARPSFAQIAFLAVIMAGWIITVEAGYIRLEVQERQEVDEWIQP
ncbi:MAG TPA: hypothetical protein EYH31_02395 [Anaerolineae bacterium]|nr:hypothetical protein [Anaerolineae bacterium]